MNDVLIIGSGLGGLACGAILSKYGFKVCVLEKNPKIGGCLQSYRRDGGTFDTGLHYVGSMNEGQTLYRIFDYLGILPELHFSKLDESGFDRITLGDDPTAYCYAQGHDNFVDTLSAQFPQEHDNIKAYVRRIQDICRRFPLYRLEKGTLEDKLDVISLNVYDEIAAITKNRTLQNVLAGTNPLYAGVKEKTPFYVHALIMNSYIEGSWRLLGGGSRLANALQKVIVGQGGEIITSAEVVKLVEEHGRIARVATKDGRTFFPGKVIAAIHPTMTIDMTETTMFRPAFYRRFHSFENSDSPFILNVTLKKDISPAYRNFNHYHYRTNDVWSYHTGEAWPSLFTLFPMIEESGNTTASIMTCMGYNRVKKWEHTFNTFFTKGDRGQAYEDFKAEQVEKLLALVETKYPGFTGSIDKIHSITPLTYRDHTGIPEGSFYGIARDCREPLKTFIMPQTKIPNLYFTGQNLNLHGVLGVAISALTTCGELVGIDHLLQAIKGR